MKNRKVILILLIIFFSNILNALKLYNIQEIERLSNYNEIKNIEVERIVDYNSYYRNKENDKVYVNGEKTPFTGVAVRKNNKKIIGLFFYEKGNAVGMSYDYYENGQLYLKIPHKYGKKEGEGVEYYPNGKLKDNRFYEKGIIIKSTEYYENGKIKNILKRTEGLNAIATSYYENGYKSAEREVIQNYSKIGDIKFIKNGRTLVYDKKGTLLADLNYKNDSIIGLQQKFYVNGKLKYDLIAASEDPKNFKAMDYAIEYYDNSDIIKLDCREKERGKGKWTCKEYNKNGSFKREFDSPTYKFKQSGTKDWINYLLPVLKLLTG